jgi:ABC-type uncharacterized transport system substrate-binding protein
VVIVSSDNSTAFAETAQALIDALVGAGLARSGIYQISATEMATRSQVDQLSQARLFVALGTDATQVLADLSLAVPVLSAMIPRSSFERILRSHARNISNQFTALQLDQPWKRQLALIRLTFPQAKRLGVLIGPDSIVKAHALRSMASVQGLSLHEEQVLAPENIFTGLRQVLDDSEVFLAIADPMIFNSNSIQNILLSSFRAQIPMVAFSPAYVRAGALLAVYTTPDQIGRQTAAQVADFLQGKVLPDHMIEPTDFEVMVNQHVARSMGLLLDASKLQQSLRRLEGLP